MNSSAALRGDEPCRGCSPSSRLARPPTRRTRRVTLRSAHGASYGTAPSGPACALHHPGGQASVRAVRVLPVAAAADRSRTHVVATLAEAHERGVAMFL